MVWTEQKIEIATPERDLQDPTSTSPIAAIPGVTQLEADAIRASNAAAPIVGTVTDNSSSNVQAAGTETPPKTTPPPAQTPHGELLSAMTYYSAAQTWWYEYGQQRTGEDYLAGFKHFSQAKDRVIRAQRHMLQFLGAV